MLVITAEGKFLKVTECILAGRQIIGLITEPDDNISEFHEQIQNNILTRLIPSKYPSLFAAAQLMLIDEITEKVTASIVEKLTEAQYENP